MLPLIEWLVKRLQTAITSHPCQVPNADSTVPNSESWLSGHRAKNTEHKARYAAHKMYGPVIRIAPTEFSINCLEDDVKTFNGDGFETEERYSMFSNYSYTVVFSHVYSNSFIHASEALTEILRSITYDRYIPRMRVWAETGTPVDIFQENNALFMDLTSAYFYGLKNGSNLVEDPDKKTVLSNLTGWMTRFGKSPLDEGAAVAFHDDFCRSMADRAQVTLQSEDFNETESYPTVYGHIYQNPEASKSVSADQPGPVVAKEIINHTAVPHEVLSITVSYLMAELARHTSVIQRLQKELLPVNLVKTPSKEIDSLPLLDAILMETLRLYPAVLGPFTHKVPEKGAMIGKYLIPGGVTVSASAYTLHRNPDVFPDPLEWNPDRWLDASPEANKQMMRWNCAFGSGRSMCSGNHFAVRLMKALIVAVFKEFQSVVVPETKIEQAEGFIGYPAGYSIMLAFRRTDAGRS